MEKEAYFWKVYELVKQIPPGKAATYGQLAALLGTPQRSRMVGQAMSRAPAFLELPCHRVVGSTGHTAPHWPQQRNLLEEEGVPFRPNGAVDLALCRWNPVETEKGPA